MGDPIDANTLNDLLATFELEGYTAQLAARHAGHVLCLACHQESPAESLQVDALARTEGASDPADMLAVAAVVCSVCDSRGTLVLGYGPEASEDDADVLARLPDDPA